MEINEETREELLSGLATSMSKVNSVYGYAIQRIEKAKSVEEIMMTKQHLLMSLSRLLPLGEGTCYFCLLPRKDCDDCEYGEHHGMCNRSRTKNPFRRPTYQKIRRAVLAFEETLLDYYKGEKYD